MAKITWLGEDQLHNTAEGGGAGPSFTRAFGGIKFPKGEAVEVDDKDIIKRASGNPFFEVEIFSVDEQPDAPKRGPGRPAKPKSDEA